MKSQIYLLSAILVAWITMGTLLYENKCCQITKVASKKTPLNRTYFHGIKLLDQEGLDIFLKENFVFYKSTFGYLTPISEDMKSFVLTTSNFLKSHPKKKLKIICRYNPSENSSQNHIDYGLLRAQQIEILFLAQNVPDKQLEAVSLRDSLLPFSKNRIYGAFIPLIVNQ
ncbi:MAG: hypothetical protein IT267_02315 [Saprospiraceae bacterium]|nr:hypothetical protein [Saprospiraceae bacterium]